ncbi:MAG: MgtC/SapB family protein [Oscillatoria sp. PMC 1051.18]|nr:MgtC/SapB family protein [Oscillatoria sp. PMC 1050.18]MEC5028446.1 MgtC/SapB family protein [Oscillatoria sp. PMC 1051.18]
MSQDLLTSQSLLSVILRLSFALLFGAVIGWERESREKPAGFRTHILVSIGSALFVLVPIQLGIAEESVDAFSRIIQGVVSGVGFLGAGEIVSQSQPETGEFRIRGLTSAAALWVSASFGILASCGLWQIGLIATGISVIVLQIFKKFE